MIEGAQTWPGERIETGTDADEEADLVARAKEDLAAFAPLYGRYLPAVYRYCYTRLGDREAAEDATSQVFTRALAALPGHRGGSFGAWLFAIAHNVVANLHRGPRDQPLPPDHDRVDPPPAPDAALLIAEEGRELHAMLAQLPPDQRRVIELRLAGLNGPEIAWVLGRSQGSVRVLQHRAIVRLRMLLIEES